MAKSKRKPKSNRWETRREAQARQRKARLGMALRGTARLRLPKAVVRIEPRVYEPAWKVYRALPGQKIEIEVESVEAWERLWMGLEGKLAEWLEGEER